MYTGRKSVSAYIAKKEISSECWNKLIRRELFDGIRFPENIHISEDFYVVFKLLCKSNSVICSSSKKYFYRRNREGSAIYNLSRHIDDKFQIHKMISTNILENYPELSKHHSGRYGELCLAKYIISVKNKECEIGRASCRERV